MMHFLPADPGFDPSDTPVAHPIPWRLIIALFAIEAVAVAGFVLMMVRAG